LSTRNVTSLISLSNLDDDARDDLLSFIEERRVIPIIGPELLMVATETGPRLLYDGTTAEFRNLYTTRLWRERITQAQRGQFPWTGRGQN
jgi:hypothetical protein